MHVARSDMHETSGELLTDARMVVVCCDRLECEIPLVQYGNRRAMVAIVFEGRKTPHDLAWRRVWVVVRGTQNDRGVRKDKSWEDLLLDLQASRQGFASVFGLGIDDAAAAAAAATAGTIHSGFGAAARAVWDQAIERWLFDPHTTAGTVAAIDGGSSSAAATDRLVAGRCVADEVVVCGHSMGGAVAQLCGVRLLQWRRDMQSMDETRGRFSIRIATFGSPAIGDRTFCEWANALATSGQATDWTNVVHDGDPVVKSPFLHDIALALVGRRSDPYQLCGEFELFDSIDDDGRVGRESTFGRVGRVERQLRALPWRWSSPLNWHAMEAYERSVMRVAPQKGVV